MGPISKLTIAVDFDGTCVAHEYPAIGMDIGAVPVLRKLTQEGAKLILNTMRSGSGLEEAVQWFKENQIPLHGVGKNPTQDSWTDSPKCHANIYIDDAALGCPLTTHPNTSRPFVDWVMIEKHFWPQNES